MKAKRFVVRRLGFEELEQRALPATVTSTNWAGYALDSRPGAVAAVGGSWTVPAVPAAGTGFSSVWAGIDGLNSPTVEQVGTESDVVNGRPRYFAWFEMYPRNVVVIGGLPVHPGDRVAAQVARVGAGQFRLGLTDLTTGRSFATTRSAPGAQRSSAEWVVEAPAIFRPLPLANFGRVGFAGATVTLGGTTHPIDTPGGRVVALKLAAFAGAGATPSPLADAPLRRPRKGAASSFTVSYQAPRVLPPAFPPALGFG
jgi:hypothetical protein